MSITFTEGRHAAEFVLAEANGNRSRESAIIVDAVAILVGQVLGLLAKDTGAVTVGAPAFTGTGDGTMTLATPAYGDGVREGTYRARLIEVGVNSGQFEVVRPDGSIDGFATVGSAYVGQINFTIADGAIDFSGAAQFTSAVAIADPTGVGAYARLDPSVGNGAQTAAAIALYPLAAAETNRKIAVIARECTVNVNCLEWPSGITDVQKAAAIADLAKQQIIVR